MSESLGLTKQQVKNLMKFISDNISMPVLGAGGGFAPIGTLNYYMGTVAPQGWLICDGTVYNIADYPEFATFIASNYGSTNAFGGDGVTTFAVPDCRGEFARMIGTNSHANQGNGANVGVHQDGTEHPFTEYDNNAGYINTPINGALNTDYASERVYTRGSVPKSNADDYGMRYTSRPTNTSWNFIVKATVSGDANGHVYSTDEQIVGTWIDGKPIYEKTVAWNDNVTADEWITTQIDATNIDEMIEGQLHRNGDTSQGVPSVTTDVAVGQTSTFDYVRFKCTQQLGGFTTVGGYLTIQYTKITS